MRFGPDRFIRLQLVVHTTFRTRALGRKVDQGIAASHTDAALILHRTPHHSQPPESQPQPNHRPRHAYPDKQRQIRPLDHRIGITPIPIKPQRNATTDQQTDDGEAFRYADRRWALRWHDRRMILPLTSDRRFCSVLPATACRATWPLAETGIKSEKRHRSLVDL